jgi:hypothetical protein
MSATCEKHKRDKPCPLCEVEYPIALEARLKMLEGRVRALESSLVRLATSVEMLGDALTKFNEGVLKLEEGLRNEARTPSN